VIRELSGSYLPAFVAAGAMAVIASIALLAVPGERPAQALT